MSDAQEMPEATLRALRASIEHWVENGKAKTPDDASTAINACALCDLFFLNCCKGCPVAAATNEKRCFTTPYCKAHSRLLDWVEGPEWRSDVDRAAFHEAAREEENFLRALVPAGSSS